MNPTPTAERFAAPRSFQPPRSVGRLGWVNGNLAKVVMSETTVHYEGSLRCRAEHAESGAVVVTNAPKENHGSGASFSPSDLLSVALGSCILSAMGIHARAMNLDIAGATARVSKQMANAPRRIAGISVHVQVPGELSESQKQKLEAAAHGCPVHNILKVEAPISFSWGAS